MESYRCKLCPRVFKERNCFAQHFKLVHLKIKPKLRSCHLCDVKVPGYRRAAHMETAHGVPAPECRACNKKFAYPFQVLRHQKEYHMGEKNFECKVCHMKFSKQHRLRQHEIKHTGERNHKCKYCDKSFKWRNNLKGHILMHMNERRHVCPHCGDSFVQQSSLTYHVTKRHPASV